MCWLWQQKGITHLKCINVLEHLSFLLKLGKIIPIELLPGLVFGIPIEFRSEEGD